MDENVPHWTISAACLSQDHHLNLSDGPDGVNDWRGSCEPAVGSLRCAWTPAADVAHPKHAGNDQKNGHNNHKSRLDQLGRFRDDSTRAPTVPAEQVPRLPVRRPQRRRPPQPQIVAPFELFVVNSGTQSRYKPSTQIGPVHPANSTHCGFLLPERRLGEPDHESRSARAR
jgi:hypothetical protein